MARVQEATGHEPTWEIEGNEVVVIAPEDLAKRTDLEEETVTEVLRVLKLELTK